MKIRTDTYGEEEAEKIEESRDASLYRATDGVLFLYRKSEDTPVKGEKSKLDEMKEIIEKMQKLK